MGKLRRNVGALYDGATGRVHLLDGLGSWGWRRTLAGLRRGRWVPPWPWHESSPGWASPETTRRVVAAARAPGEGPWLMTLPEADRAWVDALDDEGRAGVRAGLILIGGQDG